MDEREWLLFLSQLPVSPSSLRVMVWRRMHSVGAAGLQNGVWVLPRSDIHEQFFQDVLASVERQGGSAQIFFAKAYRPAVQASILSRLQSDREQEYAEFIEQCDYFSKELEKETAAEKFTLAELEEGEKNMQRLENWLSKIQRRDFFGTEKGRAAQTQIEECRAALAIYAAKVFEQQDFNS